MAGEKVSSSMCVVTGVVTSTLSDKIFTISTGRAKKHLEVVQAMMKKFAQTSADDACVTFSSWLVDILEEMVKN